MREIHINAQTWQRYYRKMALMKLSSQQGSNPVSVPTFEHDGYLFLANAGLFPGNQSNEPKQLFAYRLIPDSIYEGQTTTVYHDPEAIKSGTRLRGCLKGLVVLVHNERMVCAQQVKFVTPNHSTSAKAVEEEQMSLF
ncbi:hypothetical protein EGT81_19240 [Alcaligenes faecalis]|uniref:hypothetical protein n=1 Tax=Alcaligenes faecalis TaxID=511 RepID=UPI000F67788F|nr:hypothetical protein [Alcaligenes faecalis]RSE57574.1 hypothetical protein EGT81_19240 [Alcaligenes faecalis]